MSTNNWKCCQCKTVNLPHGHCKGATCEHRVWPPRKDGEPKGHGHDRCPQCTDMSTKKNYEKGMLNIRTSGAEKEYVGDGCVDLSQYKAKEKREWCGCVIL